MKSTKAVLKIVYYGGSPTESIKTFRQVKTDIYDILTYYKWHGVHYTEHGIRLDDVSRCVTVDIWYNGDVDIFKIGDGLRSCLNDCTTEEGYRAYCVEVSNIEISDLDERFLCCL